MKGMPWLLWKLFLEEFLWYFYHLIQTLNNLNDI